MHLMLLNLQLHLVHNTHILLLLLSLIGVHSLVVVVDCAHAIDVVNCARTTLLLLITHTHTTLVVVVDCVHTHTHKLLVIVVGFCTQNLLIGCAHFLLLIVRLC